jgi:SPP1 family predicted phage head-tail adaptor
MRGGDPLMPAQILSGKFNRRVRLLRPSVTRDASGQEVTTYTTVATVWAAIDQTSNSARGQGRERFLAQKVVAEADARIRVRFSRALAPADTTWIVERDDTATSPATLIQYRVVEPPLRPQDGRQEIHFICRRFDTGEKV